MSSLSLKIKKLILLIGDIGAMYLALYLTLIIRFGYPLGSIWGRHLLPFTAVFAVWLVVLFINDLYNLKISHNTDHLINLLVKISLANILLAVAFFYFISPILDSIKPQRILVVDILLTAAVIFIWRKLFYKFVKSSGIANKVLIVGSSPLGEELITQINKRPQLGYQARLVKEPTEDLKWYCLQEDTDILVSGYNLQKSSKATRKIFDCLSLGIDVHSLTGFYEQITGKVPVEYINHTWFLENLAEYSKRTYEVIKRAGDIGLAILGLVIAIPLSPIIILAIKLESKGPAVFKQYRIGKNGKKFLAMKFRSMVQDSEKNGPQWTNQGDPRVTNIGKFIRKTRLDEIPQLINILRGEMSFVGPRPEQPEFVKSLAEKVPFYKERLLVKPGLAGWAQLNAPWHGASEKDSLEKVKYDLYYIKNRSILMDVSILLKTAKVVFSAKGQ